MPPATSDDLERPTDRALAELVASERRRRAVEERRRGAWLRLQAADAAAPSAMPAADAAGGRTAEAAEARGDT